ncbi:hypothetical protein VMCG_08928 [Cytospora schulzeri]|uniref:Ketoreductase (KR) domain-containing protein n=1 Tax=Cytospora schulzeri TaxID=448051 RepID=A0A423VNK2_9PEZI|nr:hypothetical protein VMCG_08928 [Valsa malicola]
MSDSTVVLITGVGRGIGRALFENYLTRPNHTVIGSVRNSHAPSVQELRDLPTAEGSRLLLVSIESTSAEDIPKAVQEMASSGINHLDLVIANSGICPTPQPLETVDIEDIKTAFTVNTIGPILLWKGLKPLLEKSKRSPKWVSMSTGAASLERLEVHQAHGVAAYGITKASFNWFTLAIHSANPWLTTFAVHPGLVQTEMGNMGAKMMGMEKAPNTLEESITKTVGVIDASKRDTTSGKFLNVIDGTVIPW